LANCNGCFYCAKRSSFDESTPGTRRTVEDFNAIRRKKLIETRADDLRAVLDDKRHSTNHFLRCWHNLAIGLGWLPWPIIPAKLWPKVEGKPKRAITELEHRRIIAEEQNVERRQYYELLWHIGAAQSDARN
jgi:hypothetical protein